MSGITRWSTAALVAAAGIAMPLLGPTAAHADATFSCVASDLNTCVVTIPLTSNMNERITSTMPDTHPWTLSELDGNGVRAPYGLTGPGNPDTTWDGVGGAVQGHVFSAILTTDAGEPAGGAAVLTFTHVTPISKPTAKHYTISVTAPKHAKKGSHITITAVVKPKPAKGHLLLERKHGSTWVKVKTLTYSTHHKDWAVSVKWEYAKHVSHTYRLLATAATGLKATASRHFTIATK